MDFNLMVSLTYNNWLWVLTFLQFITIIKIYIWLFCHCCICVCTSCNRVCKCIQCMYNMTDYMTVKISFLIINAYLFSICDPICKNAAISELQIFTSVSFKYLKLFPVAISLLYCKYCICGTFGGSFNLANDINKATLNVHHLHWFPSIQYSQLPTKNLANRNFRANCQIFDSPIIPRIW